jgi:hypothetical protein
MTKNSSVPVRLYLMQLSASTVPLPQGKTMEMILACYLIKCSDGRHILIDSGMAADSRPPGLPPARDEKNVIEHLRELGLRPDDIDTLISTHLMRTMRAIMTPLGMPNSSFSANTTVWHEAGTPASLRRAITGMIRPCTTGW